MAVVRNHHYGRFHVRTFRDGMLGEWKMCRVSCKPVVYSSVANLLPITVIWIPGYGGSVSVAALRRDVLYEMSSCVGVYFIHSSGVRLGGQHISRPPHTHTSTYLLHQQYIHTWVHYVTFLFRPGALRINLSFSLYCVIFQQHANLRHFFVIFLIRRLTFFYTIAAQLRRLSRTYVYGQLVLVTFQ
jgi:hypothetical protein